MPLNVALRVTLDTGTITHRPRIDEACAGLDVELDYTTVTDRETEGWPSATTGSQVRESAVLGEWRAGVAAAGSEESGPMLEQVLQIFSSGGFPPLGSPLREALSEGNHHHLLDAMILEAHVREGRDVLVTENTTEFITGDRREVLQQLCRTKILTVAEFCAEVGMLASPA